jgi:hypothetical protein
MALKSLPLKSEISLHPSAVRKILQWSPYSDANDRLRHQHYIKHISDEMHQPIQEVTLLYERVLRGLKVNARVHEFLPIFVTKKVKDRIKERSLAPRGA